MKTIANIILFIFYTGLIFAQDISNTTESSTKEIVRDAWANTILIDNQTTSMLPANNFQFILHHRFTNINNGITDLYGLYGASNIRLGVNYSISNNLMVGFGTERDKKYQEFLLKVILANQTIDNSMPVSIALFGNTCINAKDQSYWGLNYQFADRLSYFSQLIISRKFSDQLSLLTAVSYSHFNKVESTPVQSQDSLNLITDYKSLFQNDAIGITFAGRYKIHNETSIVAEYDQAFYLKKRETQQLEPKPNLAVGVEVKTLTHVFHVFVSSYRGIIPQQNFLMNQFDFKSTKGIMLGFNMTVNF